MRPYYETEERGFITVKEVDWRRKMADKKITTAEELAEVGDEETVAVAVAASRVEEADDN